MLDSFYIAEGDDKVLSLFECYKILGVNAGAGIADITSSYKRLCRLHHPDVSADPKSEEMMKNINAADP